MEIGPTARILIGMRVNRRMRRHLDDLRARNVDAAVDPQMAARADLSVEKAGECILLSRFLHGPRRPLGVFGDPTSLECNANKLSMDEFLSERLVATCPILLLTMGLAVAERLAGELEQFEGRFNVILSYDGEACALRFHRIREGERWLHEELEEYDEEGVLVFEAGRGQPQPRLALAG